MSCLRAGYRDFDLRFWLDADWLLCSFSGQTYRNKWPQDQRYALAFTAIQLDLLILKSGELEVKRGSTSGGFLLQVQRGFTDGVSALIKHRSMTWLAVDLPGNLRNRRTLFALCFLAAWFVVKDWCLLRVLRCVGGC